MEKSITEKATFAEGCFWCTEAIFRRLKGVRSVTPGYTGGTLVNPTYEEVCSGTTGHAEAIEIEFDPGMIPYEKLLDVFFATHNPTTLNRQGNDSGTQYRSAVFYHSGKQKEAAEKKIGKLAPDYEDRIVTAVVPAGRFYPAENYHKDYFEKNRDAPYCSVIIGPKIHKLLSEFGREVKEEYR